MLGKIKVPQTVSNVTFGGQKKPPVYHRNTVALFNLHGDEWRTISVSGSAGRANQTRFKEESGMRSVVSFNESWSFHEGFGQQLLDAFDGTTSVSLPHTAVELPFNYFDEKLLSARLYLSESLRAGCPSSKAAKYRSSSMAPWPIASST